MAGTSLIKRFVCLDEWKKKESEWMYIYIWRFDHFSRHPLLLHGSSLIYKYRQGKWPASVHFKNRKKKRLETILGIWCVTSKWRTYTLNSLDIYNIVFTIYRKDLIAGRHNGSHQAATEGPLLPSNRGHECLREKKEHTLKDSSATLSTMPLIYIYIYIKWRHRTLRKI